ncbi:MAG: hypothetical protein KGI27_09950 [Thaumarchaeota archaeon]|nr:hypothetical protein [Nitrososphaerota archaeon]
MSNFPAFSNKFSVFVGAAFPNVSSSVNRAFVIVNPGGNSEHLGVVATTTGKWSLEYVDSGGTGHFVQISPSHQTNHAWIDFLGMTFDGANLKGYINGILGGTAATSGTFAPLSTDHVYLGGWMGASGGNFFNNPITVAYMWNRVLSPAEIQQLYLDPYWALVPKNYSYRTGLPVIPPTPTLQIRGSSNTQGRYGKSGIKQRVITVPEMYSFEEVRQAMAKALNDLQVHIASQLPISNYQGQNISNVGPPVAADDVVTLRYLQSVYVPPLTGTKT